MAAVATFGELIRRHGRERPDAAALIYEGEPVTYRKLDIASNRVANTLLGCGVGRGTRVAFLDRNAPEYLEVLFGAAKIGAVFVPINWRLAPPEMLQILKDASARVVVAGAEFEPRIARYADERSSLSRILVIGDHGRVEDYDDTVASASPTDPGIVLDPDDVVMQAYTSGTTGHPKGVMHSNRRYTYALRQMADVFGFTNSSVYLGGFPIFGGGVVPLLSAMFAGSTSLLERDFAAEKILELIPRHRVSHLCLAPVMLQYLLDVPDATAKDLSSLQLLWYGAAPITDRVLTAGMKLLGCNFMQIYGLTEAVGPRTVLEPDDHDPVERPELLRSCGRAAPGIELRIVDPSSGDDLAAGEVGEVWTRSGDIMVGYWQQPEETERALTPDGWLKHGDAGHLDRRGYLFLHDRMKDMIVTGGLNVYSAEVENVLMRHPDVVEVAVIGVPDERWGETVKAIIVTREGSSVDGAGLIAFAREQLAHYKCPTSVSFVGSLPRNALGKVLKNELRAANGRQ